MAFFLRVAPGVVVQQQARDLDLVLGVGAVQGEVCGRVRRVGIGAPGEERTHALLVPEQRRLDQAVTGARAFQRGDDARVFASLRLGQGRVAVPDSKVGVGPARKQQAHRGFLPGTGSGKQSGAAGRAGFGLMDLGAVVKEQSDDFRVAGRGCRAQGSGKEMAVPTGPGSGVLEQQAHGFGAAHRGGKIKRGAAHAARLQVGPVVEQQSQHGRVAVVGGGH